MGERTRLTWRLPCVIAARSPSLPERRSQYFYKFSPNAYSVGIDVVLYALTH